MFYYDQVANKNFQISYVKSFLGTLTKKYRIIAHVARKYDNEIGGALNHYKKKTGHMASFPG